MAFLRGITGFFIAIVLTAFCVLNMQSVQVVWNPLREASAVPLYAIILVSVSFGFLLGSFMVWLNSLPARWSQRKKIKILEKELKNSERAPEVLEIPAYTPKTGNFNEGNLP